MSEGPHLLSWINASGRLLQLIGQFPLSVSHSPRDGILSNYILMRKLDGEMVDSPAMSLAAAAHLL
jgi:hypothetical protein